MKAVIYGPLRVTPGSLAVTRSFGDVRAKDPYYNGKKGVVIAIPEIKAINIKKHDDFIIMASDGIWDKITNKDAVNTT